MVKVDETDPYKWFTDILRDSDRFGGRFYVKDGTLWRVEGGTHTNLGVIEFTGFNVYWTPQASIRYLDVPFELRSYEDRRRWKQPQETFS